MSDDKQRYKIGDELKATLVIIDDDNYDGNTNYSLKVKGLFSHANDVYLDENVTTEELDMAFNRAFIKRKLQDDIDKATKQLEEMG